MSDNQAPLKPTLRAVIVDDEARARRILESLLQEYCPQVEVVGMAGSVLEAVKVINMHEPDVVFLDIEMPVDLGFALFEYFPNLKFNVVFITAYQQYAVNAFKVSAVDYILKPIDIDLLVQAVSKVQRQIDMKELNEKVNTLKLNLNQERQIKRLALNVSDGVLFLDVDNILYLEADGSYTYVVTNNSRILVSKKMSEFEELEQHPHFFKPHRSFLINMNKVDKLVKSDGGYIIMNNQDQIELSRYKKEEFFEAIKKAM